VVSAGIVRLWDYNHRVIPLVNASDGLEGRASLAEVAEADYIAAHADAPILLPSSEYQRAPLAFLLATRYPRRAGAQQAPLAAGEAIMIIQPTAPDRPTTDGIPAGYRPDEWVLLKDGVAYFLPPAADSFEAASGRRTPIVAENGVTVAAAVPGHWKGASASYVPLRASFADGLDLVGYQVGELTPGRELPVSLLWRPRAKITGDAEMFVQVRDRQAVAGVHAWPLHGAYRVRAWRPGETVPVSASLAVPENLAPGAYELIAGVYDLVHRRPVTTASGDGQQLVIRLKVPLPPDDRAPQILQTARFGNSIALTGQTLSPAEGGLSLTLFWEATGAPTADYTAFVHVVDANGKIVAQSDGEPLQGSYPTSIWGPGERVVEQRTIAAPPGTYQVYTGWYRNDTQERLPVASSAGADSENRLALGAITVP
jgi:hypothetical protein